MRQFLEGRELWEPEAAKPADPKAAMEAACREKGVKPVSALFGRLAKSVSLQRCEDRSFVRLRDILRKWFPRTPE